MKKNATPTVKFSFSGAERTAKDGKRWKILHMEFYYIIDIPDVLGAQRDGYKRLRPPHIHFWGGPSPPVPPQVGAPVYKVWPADRHFLKTRGSRGKVYFGTIGRPHYHDINGRIEFVTGTFNITAVYE